MFFITKQGCLSRSNTGSNISSSSYESKVGCSYLGFLEIGIQRISSSITDSISTLSLLRKQTQFSSDADEPRREKMDSSSKESSSFS
jgi:hypothetical protein